MSSRAWRWIRRIVLGVLAFVVVIAGVVLAVLHTDWGRGIARDQVEARLNDAFTGGAKVGSLEGSVLGDMVLRDVVLNGPDRKPAITIKTLKLGLGILPLFSKQARVRDLRAEGVDIDLRRDPDGVLQTARMFKPGPKSGWAVVIPELVVDGAHVRVQGANGGEDVNLDEIHLSGDIHMPANDPLDANVLVMARWRERAAPVWLDTNLNNDDGVVTVSSLLARVGEVRVTGAGIRIVKPQPASLVRTTATQVVLSGLVSIEATKQAIAQLVPSVNLPVDTLDLAVIAAPVPLQSWTHVTASGLVDGIPVYADLEADLEVRHARGMVSTGTLDLTKLSGGKLEGTGTTFITFDALAPSGETALPVGGAMIHAGGDLAGYKNALATIAVASSGERAATVITAKAVGTSALIGGQIRKVGDRVTLESSRVIAKVGDPARASRGKAPVHGNLSVDVAASGVLLPAPDLAVTGRVIGSNLRAQDLKVRSLDLAVAARHLPSKPTGKAELKARDVERGNVFLRELDINAANRGDGKIAVTMRTKPRTSPWLVEADALVTPGETITIDLERHHIRAGNGGDWTGTTGRIVIAPTRIAVKDLASASKDSRLAAAGHLDRGSGDLKAQIDVSSFELANLSTDYKGVVQAKVDVERTRGVFSGVVDVEGRGLTLDPRVGAIDATARIAARADKLVVDAKATSPSLGTVDLDVDIDAPKDITNAVAWKKLHREHIRSARLQLVALDVAKLASLAKLEGAYTGKIDGDIVLSPTTTGGLVQLREVDGPILKSLGPLSANLTLSQTGPDELTPTLVATIDDRRAAGTPVQKPLAKVQLQATLAMADHLFDPAAWHALGKGAFKGGALEIHDVMIEPPLLERLHVTTNLRGRASLVAELAPNAESAKAQLQLRQLRGHPIEQPVSIDVLAQIDNAATTVAVELVSPSPVPQKLLVAKARVPVTMDTLIASPAAFATAKLEGTATLPEVPAPRMLQTFGRTQVIGGTLTGTIDVAGTLAKPTLRARVAGTNLQVPPGPRGKPVKTIKRIGIDATWDGAEGKLAIDATQDKGMLQLLASGDPTKLDTASVSLVAKQFDLMPLLVFAPGPAGGAGGRLDAKLDMKGLDLRRAKLAGEVHLVDGRIPINPAVGTLRRAKIDVVIGDQVKVNVDGRIGGGSVKATATLAMAGAMPTSGDAKIYLRGVSPIGVVEPDVTADITAKLTRRPDAWVADIDVAKGVVKVPDARGEKLDPVGKPDDMVYLVDGKAPPAKEAAVGEENAPVAPSLIANITIRRTYIESDELRGYVRGKLRIERDAETVGIVGKIEAERGDLDLFGRRYQLDRGVVQFDGSTDPRLDIIIVHDFTEVTTRTQVRGRLSKPQLVMSSDPGTYSQGQLLGFLLGGEPSGRPADGNPRDKAVGAGASLIANKIGGYVKDALPLDIDVLRYESATATSGAAITVGTWISRSLFVAYRQRINARPDENGGEGEVEYWLNRRVVVEGVVGDRGYNGVDLLWRRRY